MPAFDAEQLVQLTRITAVAPSPDGTWLAVAAQRLDQDKESSYVSDLWRVPLDGDEPTLLTRGEWNDHSPAFRHDGVLVFLSNRPTGDDDEHDRRSQVFAIRPWGGDPEPLTNEPLGVQSFVAATHADVMCVIASRWPGIAEDEQRAHVKERREKGPTELVYDRMPVRFWDHWLPTEMPHLIAYVGGQTTDLWPQVDRELLRTSIAVAPDGSYVLAQVNRRGADRLLDTQIELFDIGSTERRTLAGESGAWFNSPCPSPDSASVALAYHKREEGRFGESRLLVVDVETGDSTTLDADWEDELSPVGWTPDGSAVLASGALQTHRPVFRVDADSGAIERVTARSAGGTHSGVSVFGTNSGKIAGVRSSLRHPPEPFVCDVAVDAEPTLPARLSGFDGADFVTFEDHAVTSTDGTDVQYTVVRPMETGEDSPALMWIHGGPISDWGDVWHWRWNSLVPAALGYVTVLPNPRGSVGFGTEFIEGIWGNQWGGQCYEDLMAVADEVSARDDVDPARIVAMGGSFGGYMTNWIGTQTDRFACLVTHASLFDLAAFHGVTDHPAWWAHSFGVDPYAERKSFDTYSPIAHVDGWKSPVLIIHGEKDYRVPIGEALAMFEALDFHGVDARLLIYPDENHWILRPKNIVSWYGRVADFIGQHVGMSTND